MKKGIKLLLMLCLSFSAMFSIARNDVTTEKRETREGGPIEIKESSTHNGWDKSSSILASVDGHYLTVVFTENLGEVRIVVSEAGGGTFDIIEMYTPNGYSANILDTGSYVVTFYLTNGDEYYGEFEVTE